MSYSLGSAATSFRPQVFPLRVPPGFKATRVMTKADGSPCVTNPGSGYTSRGQHWPPEHPVLYDSYDELRGSPGVPHHAMDITCADGTPVVASNDGTVLPVWVYQGQRLPGAGSSPKGGWYVYVRGDDGYETYYAHMGRIYVKPGQRVQAGQVLGLCSNTGNAEGGCAHLHYAVTDSQGNKLNPYDVLDPLYTAGGWQGTPIGWPPPGNWAPLALGAAAVLAGLGGLAWWRRRRKR